MQTKVIYIVFYILMMFFSLFKSFGQVKNDSLKAFTAESKKDTIAIFSSNDSTQAKNINKNKQKLTDLVYRKAKGYEKLNQKKKQVTLFDEAVFKYQEYELNAGIIVYDYAKEELYAGRIPDSLGKMTQHPVFKQGNQVVEPDSIRFNMKSKRAMVWNTRTQYGEFNIKAERSKRMNDSLIFMKNIRFTTSEDVDNPEYYFKTNKLKMIPGDKVVTGATQMVVADVPTPAVLPFAFFPISTQAVSGFIMPAFGDANGRGYYLQNAGYYLSFGDKADATITGDFYTNGSYAVGVQSSYAQRYRYNGNVNIRYENIINSELGMPDYTKMKNYNIQWSHSQDQKANPTSRFQASVNLGSSNYFRNSMNQRNLGSNMNNTLSSSITYNKTFETTPQVNFTASMNHQQNTNTQQISIGLPKIQANVDRVFPFAPKSGTKKGAIQNINLQYTLRGENNIQTTDSLFFKRAMFDNLRSGFSHSIPISTNFKLLKYLSMSMAGNFTENWVFHTTKKYFNENENRVVEERINGFDAFRQYNLSASMGTTIYGTFLFKKGRKFEAIRHVIRPQLSYSYTPSFDQYYDTYAIDANGTTMEEYTRFQGGLFGTPNKTMSNIVSMNIGNNIEAKVRDDKSPEGKSKKVPLLNSLNFSTSYNITSDSLKLAPIRVSTTNNFFDNKLQLTMSTTMDAYGINNQGQRINTLNIKNGGSLFRMTSANATVNYSLSSNDPLFGGNSTKANNNNQNVQNGGRGDDLFGQSVDLADRRTSMFDNNKNENDEPTQFYKSSIPWDINLAYSVTYSNNNRTGDFTNNSLMFSGNINLTPAWKVGFSSGYDFKNKGVTYTQLRFERDLKSWRMDFSWIPTGYYKQWTFFIGIKSTVLQDIKYEKRNTADRRYN